MADPSGCQGYVDNLVHRDASLRTGLSVAQVFRNLQVEKIMKPPPKLPPRPDKPAEILRVIKGGVGEAKEKMREAAKQVKELADEIGEKAPS